MRYFFLSVILFSSVLTGLTFISSCKGEKNADDETEKQDSTIVEPETFSEDSETDDLIVAEDHEMKEPVEKRLTDLFAIAKSGKYKSGTEFLAYRGNDAARVWKDTFHSSDELESEVASYSLQEIKDWLGKSAKYEFGGFYTQEKNGLTWLVQEVTFDRDNKPLKITFWLLELNDQLAVGEMK